MARRRKPGSSLTLSDPRAGRALASPHRLEIIAALGDAGAVSIAELARRLGRTPHSLYYHVKQLAAAGIVVPAEVRHRGRHDERIWTLVADRILLGAAADGSGRDGSRAVDAMLRLTSRELQLALRRARSRRGEGPSVIGLRMKGRLDEATLTRLRRLIAQMEAVIQRANRRGRTGRLYALTIVLTPTEDRNTEEA